MSDTGQFVQQDQDADIWRGLQQFSTLPAWLASIKDTERTLEALSRAIPDFANGFKILNKVRIGHMLFTENYWQNLCTLYIRFPGAPEEKTIDLNGRLFPPEVILVDKPVIEGILGSDEWHAYIPELHLELNSLLPETVLEAFELLTDPVQSRKFLEENIRSASTAYRNLRIQSCKPEIVRYKPGNRCTILYHLGYSADMPVDHYGPPVVVAKTYQKEKGQNAYDSMLALWNALFRSSNSVHVAEPLAYNSEHRVLIQGPVWEEQTLTDLILSAIHTGTPQAVAELNAMMQKTAVGLAELHKSKVEIGRMVTWEEEIEQVQGQVKQLSAVFPQLLPAAEPFLKRLKKLEAEIPPDPFVPSHGTFRPSQVLLYKGEISFIDFDSFCQSEPSRDLSLFLSTIMSIGLTLSPFDKGKDPNQTIAEEANWEARFSLISSICKQFLDVYEQYQPVSLQRVALWEALNLFYYVLSGWMKVKIKGNEIEYLVKTLDHFIKNKF